MTRVVQTAKTTGNAPRQLIDSMTEAVRQFVGQAEQSDDLTMLVIKVANDQQDATEKETNEDR